MKNIDEVLDLIKDELFLLPYRHDGRIDYRRRISLPSAIITGPNIIASLIPTPMISSLPVMLFGGPVILKRKIKPPMTGKR
jgi:hypothetical protein